MSSMFTSKKSIVISVVVLILLFMRIDSFAGEEWKRITQIPTQPRLASANAVVDNKIYIIGGTHLENFRNGPNGLSTVEVYDTKNDTWQRVADMPTPREAAKAAVVNGIIYVFGGLSRKKDADMEYPVHVEAYDAQTDTWTRKGDMPVSRIYFSLGVVAGKVYLIGGSTGLGAGHEGRTGRVDVYDPATDTWVKGPPKMPTGRDSGSTAVVKNRIYVLGGLGWPPGGWGTLLMDIEAYDPISRHWQKKADMLEVRLDAATVVVSDEIYLIGGVAGVGQFLATVDVYNPRTEAWRTVPPLPMPFSTISRPGAATVNRKIYVLGGLTGEFQLVSDVFVFDTSGFRAVEANSKLLTRWSELKVEHRAPRK